ncbi:MAG: hemolysin III family protein [Spirochaetales bacterium]|nr:hemolysin III family protein [Spirochaetales bacterium]
MSEAYEQQELRPSEIAYESGGVIEEIFNSLTHAIGAGLAISGLTALIMLTNQNPDPWKYVSFTVYGASQILLYLSSALMHSFASLPRIRYYLRIVDQSFIYLLIAGTYTPVTLTVMRGPWGWSIFGVIWGLAVLGILLKTLVFRNPHIITDLLYIPMGWIVLIAARPMVAIAPDGLIRWMLIGGAFYTVGVAFYAWRRLPFSHTIWHLFVIGGSVSFFMGFSLYLA